MARRSEVKAHMAQKITTLKIQGMHCDGCAQTVARELRSVNGVTEVTAEFEKKRAIVVIHSAHADRERLTKAVTEGP